MDTRTVGDYRRGEGTKAGGNEGKCLQRYTQLNGGYADNAYEDFQK